MLYIEIDIGICEGAGQTFVPRPPPWGARGVEIAWVGSERVGEWFSDGFGKGERHTHIYT